MDLKLPITIIDELSEDEVRSQGELDLASGEIRNVRYEDHDVAAQGVPATLEGYEFTVGVLRNGPREVEFRIEADAMSGTMRALVQWPRSSSNSTAVGSA